MIRFGPLEDHSSISIYIRFPVPFGCEDPVCVNFTCSSIIRAVMHGREILPNKACANEPRSVYPTVLYCTSTFVAIRSWKPLLDYRYALPCLVSPRLILSPKVLTFCSRRPPTTDSLTYSHMALVITVSYIPRRRLGTSSPPVAVAEVREAILVAPSQPRPPPSSLANPSCRLKSLLGWSEKWRFLSLGHPA